MGEDDVSWSFVRASSKVGTARGGSRKTLSLPPPLSPPVLFVTIDLCDKIMTSPQWHPVSSVTAPISSVGGQVAVLTLAGLADLRVGLVSLAPPHVPLILRQAGSNSLSRQLGRGPRESRTCKALQGPAWNWHSAIPTTLYWLTRVTWPSPASSDGK